MMLWKILYNTGCFSELAGFKNSLSFDRKNIFSCGFLQNAYKPWGFRAYSKKYKKFRFLLRKIENTEFWQFLRYFWPRIFIKSPIILTIRFS